MLYYITVKLGDALFLKNLGEGLTKTKSCLLLIISKLKVKHPILFFFLSPTLPIESMAMIITMKPLLHKISITLKLLLATATLIIINVFEYADLHT